MTTITDEEMAALLRTTKPYTLVVLRPGPHRNREDAARIIREHGRRNLSLRADGFLSIVCPVGSDTLAGVGVFSGSVEDVTRLMRDDPALQAEVLTFEVFPCRSFPGDSLG